MFRRATGQFDERVRVLGGRPAKDRLGLLGLTSLPKEVPKPRRRLWVGTSRYPAKHLDRLILMSEVYQLAGNVEEDILVVGGRLLLQSARRILGLVEALQDAGQQ